MKLTKPTIIGMIAAAAVVVGLALAYAAGAFNLGSKVPDVKFIDFSPEGSVTIKQGQQFAIKFNVENKEPYDVSGVNVRIIYDSEPQYFTVDKPYFAITDGSGPQSLGANGSRSGLQTVNVTGNPNQQDALETVFTVSLHVTDGQLSDTKTFNVRLEK